MAPQANSIDQNTRQRAEKGIERLRDEYMDVLFRRPDELPETDEALTAMGFPSAEFLLSGIGELAAKRIPELRRPMPSASSGATAAGADRSATAAAVPAGGSDRTPQRQSYLAMVEAIVKEHAANQNNRKPAA